MIMYLKEPLGKLYDRVILGIDFIVAIFIKEHLNPCKDQECPEYVHNPTELFNKCRTHKNEYKTHHNGS